MPACCSPLNGVTIGCVSGPLGSQPSWYGRFGSLNHSPRWYWWVGANVVVPSGETESGVMPPGETENVSTSKTPRTVTKPLPWLSAWTSVWYHDTPNGLSGCWITNRSKSLLAGMPWISTAIRSFSPWGTMTASPRACGRQDLMPGEATRRKPKPNAWPEPATAATLFTGPADAPVRLRDAATAPAVTAVAARPRMRILLNFINVTNGLHCLSGSIATTPPALPPRANGVGGMLSPGVRPPGPRCSLGPEKVSAGILGSAKYEQDDQIVHPVGRPSSSSSGSAGA